MASTQASSIQKLQRAIKAQPQKTAVLAILVVVMLGAWVKLAMRSGASPASASADSSAGSSVLVSAAPAPASPTAVALAAWLEGSCPAVTRNLFALKLDYYPQDGSRVDNILREGQGNGFWDQLKKSLTVRVDQAEARKILENNLRLQATQLNLQTIVFGATPRALIDGELVGVGDVVGVAKFRVVKIEARQVTVEKEGIALLVTIR